MLSNGTLFVYLLMGVQINLTALNLSFYLQFNSNRSWRQITRNTFFALIGDMVGIEKKQYFPL